MTKKFDNTPKYNHISKDFGSIVDAALPSLDILKYYPYGKETMWSYWLCGDVDLRKEYLSPRYKNKSENDIVGDIIAEVARAMSYLMVHGNDHFYDRQRIEAFALIQLFNFGDVGWSKKPLEGLTLDQQKKLFVTSSKNAKLLSGYKQKYPNKTKEQKDALRKLKKAEEICNIHHLEKYGVYEVRIKPLTQYRNTTHNPKILYSKKELCAIYLMVICAFENLC